MDIFISWSGPRSGAAAEALRNWLPKIINAVRPWLSSADVDKGARWGVDIAVRLEAAKAGIICLTPGNVHSDWILFEAGALSKTLTNTFVCPLLIGLEPSEITGPLAQFQATRAIKRDVLKLVQTLNTGLGEAALADAHLEEAFEVWWPKLDSQLAALPQEGGESRPSRSDRDLLEELLDYARNQNRAVTLALSDEDKKQILTVRAWKAMRSIHGQIGGATGVTQRGIDLELSMDTTRGKDKDRVKYKIVVPATASPDEMESLALAQIRDTDRGLAEQKDVVGGTGGPGNTSSD